MAKIYFITLFKTVLNKSILYSVQKIQSLNFTEIIVRIAIKSFFDNRSTISRVIATKTKGNGKK